MMQTDWQREDITWLELLALLATCLIWAGVGLMSVGLFLAYRDLQSEVQVLAAGGSLDQPVVLVVTEMPSPEPSFTPTAIPTATSVPPTQVAALPTDPPKPTATVAVTEETRPTPTTAPTEAPRVERTKHVVAAGDSLWSIATDYGVSVDSLLAANGLTSDAVLHPGKELVIPAPGEVLPTVPPPGPTSTSPPGPTSAPAANIQALPSPTNPAMEPPISPGVEQLPTDRKGNPPTRLVISSISLDSPIVPVGWKTTVENGQKYTLWEVADYAVGWHKTSAYPGQAGNTVLAGHHNIKGEVFRYLVDVAPGDEVDLYAGEGVYKYKVTEKLILREKDMPEEVRLQNAQWIASTKDERLTLVTCWPYTNNTHRVIVVAKPMEN